MMSLEQFRNWFNQQFFILLENKCNEFSAFSETPSIKVILSHLMALAKDGKRIRAYMAYVGYTTEGGEHNAFPLYAAIELLHLFCLIHDDIIDHGLIRRNIATLHAVFDIPTALLIGDLMVSWSFECLVSVEELEPYTIDDCKKEYLLMLDEVIHGQLLDTMMTNDRLATRDSIDTVIQLKSAHYSFYRPLILGMLLAGADTESFDFAKAYAVNLGIAFQLQDDIADSDKDEKNGQQTVLSWYRHTHPDTGPKQARVYVQQLIEDHLEASRDAIIVYNKDADSVWEDILGYFDNC